jgi:TPP-dependent 2-oxoacid decarboxylase
LVQYVGMLSVIELLLVTRHLLLSPITRYEFQMQYGSIGWSVGATLGYAQAAKDKRVIACIGDGSFQV